MRMNSELLSLIALARMGFSMVPVHIRHKHKGDGMLYMDGDGMRFVPSDSTETLIITWEQFNNGAPESEEPCI